MQLGKSELAFDVGDFILQSTENAAAIDLIAYNDTLIVGRTGAWNDLFWTNPIAMPTNGNLVFQNNYSVVNPQLLGTIMPPSASISFSLEAVDATTNIPLATLYKQTVRDVDTLRFSGKRQVPIPSVLTGQLVYLRVAVSTQGPIAAKPSIVEIYQEVADSTSLPRQHFAGNSDLPKAIMLYPNYPNPFNPSTQIRFHLSIAGAVSLRIYKMSRAARCGNGTTNNLKRENIQSFGMETIGRVCRRRAAFIFPSS